MISKRIGNTLFVIILLKTNFLIRFGFASRAARNPQFEDFKHFPSLIPSSKILSSDMTRQGLKLPHLEALSNLSPSSRFVSPRPTRKELGYRKRVRGPRNWDIKKTPQVKSTQVKWPLILSCLFVCNWGGVKGLYKEARSIPNAKLASSSVHKWNNSWQASPRCFHYLYNCISLTLQSFSNPIVHCYLK